jgi:hypothetical protein
VGAGPACWRKAKDWRRQLKNLQRTASQIVHRGGPNKEARVKSAVREYLAVGRELSIKVQASLLGLCDQAVDANRWERLAYFHAMLDQHLNLVERRLLKGETIPAHEKVFSLFEPHTEWIQKGKQRPNVELGHRLLVATDQHQIIQDYDVLLQAAEVEMVPQAINESRKLIELHLSEYRRQTAEMAKILPSLVKTMPTSFGKTRLQNLQQNCILQSADRPKIVKTRLQ